MALKTPPNRLKIIVSLLYALLRYLILPTIV